MVPGRKTPRRSSNCAHRVTNTPGNLSPIGIDNRQIGKRRTKRSRRCSPPFAKLWETGALGEALRFPGIPLFGGRGRPGGKRTQTATERTAFTVSYFAAWVYLA